MSNRTSLKRAGRAGTVLAMGVAFAAFPVAAQAAHVDLATAGPFVVLGGQSVTNTGPSVLNGDLGVSPGTSITGFGPGVVNGVTHVNDGVASQAQADLTTAYNAAASEPVAAGSANDLTGQNLGSRTLTPGAYGYSSSAQLTGTLTLDAQGNPNAQFVFKIGSTLTTASASSVALINGASACNVFWQVGSSATIGTTTAFQGNLMALTSITLNTGASVIGRALARNGDVTLDDNVLDASSCGAGSTGSTPPGTPPTGTTPTGTTPTGTKPTSAQVPPASASKLPARNGTATFRRVRRAPRLGRPSCTEGFRATVRGKMIKRVVFSLDGKRIRSTTRSPFSVYVRALPGKHKVKARVTFKDATRPKTRTLDYRACAAVALQPRSGPSQFTG